LDDNNHKPEFDREHPLDRIDGESLRANTAFRDYVFEGPGRSVRKLLAVYEKRVQSVSKASAENDADFSAGDIPTLRLPTLFKWSTRFFWQERIDAFEVLRAREKQQRWAERVEALEEREWKIGNAFLDLVEAGLAEGPKFVRTHRRIVKATNQEIITMQHDLLGINTSAKTGDQMLRLAAGMDTERQHHEHSGPGGGPIPVAHELDLSDLDDEQIRDALGKLGGIALALANGDTFRPGDIVSPPGDDAEDEHPESEDPRSTNP
jgi:hypothetical protein